MSAFFQILLQEKGVNGFLIYITTKDELEVHEVHESYIKEGVGRGPFIPLY
jgi:hypothetical protein